MNVALEGMGVKEDAVMLGTNAALGQTEAVEDAAVRARYAVEARAATQTRSLVRGAAAVLTGSLRRRPRSPSLCSREQQNRRGQPVPYGAVAALRWP